MPVAVIELKEDREFYLLPAPDRQTAPRRVCDGDAVSRDQSPRYAVPWPVKLPGIDGKVLEWHRSAAEAAEHAMKHGYG